MRHQLVILALAAALIYLYSPASSLQMEQSWANFSQTDVADVRGIFNKACIIYGIQYPQLVEYVRGEMKEHFGSYWNVVLYDKREWNTQFHITGTYDSAHLNKRYYQVVDAPMIFSMLILETNNTKYDPPASKTVQTIRKEGPFQTKTKSDNLTAAQEKGIELAVTTAFTWNRNIVDFTKALQKLIEVNLDEHWEVLTSISYMHSLVFRYTSPYDQWIEYLDLGVGTKFWHVRIWRNVRSG